ncbi:MAG: YccF domain-containing protein, partial [Steroidobacteraceae bacterium]
MEARQPDPTLVSYVHIMYGLHALSALIGITSSVTVAGSFIFGIPSIIAIIMNYVRRTEAEGTWLDSHFAWQRRTFWYAAFWTLMTGIVSGLLLCITIIGIPFGIQAFKLRVRARGPFGRTIVDDPLAGAGEDHVMLADHV